MLIQGENLFSVTGTTHVRVENVAVPRISPNLMMVSDFPERLTENGEVFTSTLPPEKPSRFLYFHYNPPGQPERRIVLHAQNLSSTCGRAVHHPAAAARLPRDASRYNPPPPFLVNLIRTKGG